MGSGTSSGVQTPLQPGVILRERENFPLIPSHLLHQTPERLQVTLGHLHQAKELNNQSLFAHPDTQKILEEGIVVYDFAKTAVERALKR